MSKRHTITLHHVITVFNEMFDPMDGMVRSLPKKKAMEGRLSLCCEVCAAKAVQILYGSDWNDWYPPYYGTYPGSLLEVAII
jgi:dihydroorotase